MTTNTEADYNAWKEKFEARLPNHGHAERSWEKLKRTGADLSHISYLLWLSCEFVDSPGYQALSWLRVAIEIQAKEMKRVSKKLKEASEAIKAFYGDEQQADLAVRLDALEEELVSVSGQGLRQISTRKLNPLIFRAWLIEEVRETVSRPLFRELSSWLDVAYEAHGQDVPYLSPESLRKTHQRNVATSAFSSPTGQMLLFRLAIIHAIFSS